MFSVHVDKIGDVSVIRCEGRMIGSDAAFKLRDEVRRQRESKFVLLDLSELSFMGADVLGMIAFLRAWAQGLAIQLKLFDPPLGVRQSLQRLRPTVELEVASMEDVLSLLHWDTPRCRAAATEPVNHGLTAA